MPRRKKRNKLNSIYQFISDNEVYFKAYEDAFKGNAHHPHYAHFILPLYKFLGGNSNPLISVPLTFLITDYFLHQLLGKLALKTYDASLVDDYLPILSI